MTLSRSWPLYGVLALALVVRAGWADEAPCKTTKSPCCSEQKQNQKNDEKCCIEEAIERLVQLGQLCNPTSDDDADSPKCPEPSKKRSLTVGLGIRLPLPTPFVSVSCKAESAKAAACTPCPENCPPCGDHCTPCSPPAAEKKEYCIKTCWVRNEGNQHKTLLAPKVTVPEGESARVCIAQEVARKVPVGYYSQESSKTPMCDLEFQVISTGPKHARLKLSRPGFGYVRATPGGRFVLYKTVSVIESNVELGKSCKLPLSHDDDAETATEYFNVEVNAIAPESAVSADCMYPNAASKASMACAPCVPPISAAVAWRTDVCPPQPYVVPAQGCVAPSPVAVYQYAEPLPRPRTVAMPTMYLGRTFRKSSGELLVEPPPAGPGAPVMPMPVGTPMPCPVPYAPLVATSYATPAIAACTAATTTKDCGDATKICVVTEDGKSRLEVQCGNDSRMSFSDMNLKVAGGAKLTIATHGDRVQVSTAHITAVADEVSVSVNQNCVCLEGNVKIHYRGKGKEGSTAADKASINLNEGKVSINVELSTESDD